MEKDGIQQSAECCRKILNHVNEEVKVMENLLVRPDASQRRRSTDGWPPSDHCGLHLSSDSEGIPAQTGYIRTEAQ